LGEAEEIYALCRSLHEGASDLLRTWQATLGPENVFGRHAVVKTAGFIPEDHTGILAFATDGGLVHWRFSMELGPAFAAAKLGLDITRPLSEPDAEGICWLGEG